MKSHELFGRTSAKCEVQLDPMFFMRLVPLGLNSELRSRTVKDSRKSRPFGFPVPALFWTDADLSALCCNELAGSLD